MDKSWLLRNSGSITIWCGALCTFAIYSVLYNENKFYRFFEHVFIGLGAGYSVYITWTEYLGPKWWSLMVNEGQWYWAFAAVAGSMFYFVYSKKHAWISRILFGALMGLAAGGMFREFYETYFPQIGGSMKPIITSKVLATHQAGPIASHVANALIFYVILFACMTYFFFSFEHKSAVVTKTASAGRWFLMIGFGAIFGATVMGRMTLLVGRVNFLTNDWWPEVRLHPYVALYVSLAAVIIILLYLIGLSRQRRSSP